MDSSKPESLPRKVSDSIGERLEPYEVESHLLRLGVVTGMDEDIEYKREFERGNCVSLVETK
jgi:hypothetical protein